MEDSPRSVLEKALCSRFPDLAVLELERSGFFARELPEFCALHGVIQPPQFHPEGDVFTHTLLMLRHMVFPDPLIGWSVLLHDIGKPGTQSFDPDGRPRFFGHEQKGAEMAQEILARFQLPQGMAESIVKVIREHMRWGAVCDMKESKVSAMLREKDFALALELHRLDCISSHKLMGGFNRALHLYAKQMERPPEPAPLLTGKDLLAAGFAPGPEMGKILNTLRRLQLSGALHTREEALRHIQGETRS